jgi:hypothetical protein
MVLVQRPEKEANALRSDEEERMLAWRTVDTKVG